MRFPLKNAAIVKSMLSGAAIAALTAGGALAQTDQIIVTATKRPQTLQEVPVAVSVVDADVVEKAFIQDLFDLQASVPSLRVTQLQNSSQTNFLIRGFGNGANNPGIEGSVGVFIDGVYRSRSAAAILDLPTLERVEVLRGPQSTLFGKNVSAGAISITTKAPDFDWGGSVEASYGNFNQVLFKGTLTGPLSDTLAFRVSGSINEREGYYDNIVNGTKVNERSRWSARAQLLWEPTDTLSFRAIGEYNKIDEVCCGAVQLFNGPATEVIGAGTVVDIVSPIILGGMAPGSLVGGVPIYTQAQIDAATVSVPIPGLGAVIGDASDPFGRQVTYNLDPTNQLTGKGISLQADWDIGFAAVTSITSYREQDDNTNTDADFTSLDAIENPQTRAYGTFTQEIRIASTGDNRLDWLVGGYFFDENVDFQRDIIWGPDTRAFADSLAFLATGSPVALTGFETAPPPTGLGLPFGTFFAPGGGVFGDYTLDNRSYSFFGQADFNVTDRLTISGGVSYINDRKIATGTSTLTDAISNVDLNLIGLRGAVLSLTSGAVDILTAPPAVVDATLATPLPLAALMGGFVIDPQSGAILTDPQTIGSVANAIAAADCYLPSPALLCNSALALAPFQFFQPQVNFPNPADPLDNGRLTDDKVTYSARIAYDVTDSINVYFTYATGWKAGAFNLSSDSRPPDATGFGRTARPEDVTLYEVGLKANFDGGFINIALFDQTIEDFQSNLFIGTGFVLANAEEQSVRGFEIESAYSPIDPLQVTFGLTYLDPEYDVFTQAPCTSFAGFRPAGCAPDPVTGFVPDFFDGSGLTPAGIHEISISTSAVYTHDFASGAQGFARIEYLYESDVQALDNIPPEIASRRVSLINASVGYEMENGFAISVWGRNLNNDNFLLSGFPSVAQSDPRPDWAGGTVDSFTGYTNEPRTYGVTVRKSF